MFPLPPGDELFFKVSSNSHHQQYKFQQDLIPGHHDSVDGCKMTNDMGKSPMDTEKIIPGSKKLIHRDIERQRRQEMTNLYASLRTLLPLDFIKGKRSISDQMNQAVNYIKYLEKKIKELGVKRDELKSNFGNNTASKIESSDQKTSSSSNRFMIRPSLVGIEVAYYSCGNLEQKLPLSKVLEVLLDEGLSVVNCVSARVDERLLHTIQTEVKDPTSFNIWELQQKLTQVK